VSRRSPPPAASRRAGLHQPLRHAEFSDTDSLLDWVELLAAETGLPVGIKSAVGDMQFWDELTTLMADTDRGVDFVTIDGGEGGPVPRR
jgi:glutamate synthase domain-containing protein 2